MQQQLMKSDHKFEGSGKGYICGFGGEGRRGNVIKTQSQSQTQKRRLEYCKQLCNLNPSHPRELSLVGKN